MSMVGIKRMNSIGIMKMVSVFAVFAIVSAPQVTADDYAYLDDLYQHLHRNPELSGQEVETSKRIAAEMRTAGFDVTENFGGYGVVGIMRNGDGPTVLLRADMDGLPVKEDTGLAYASQAMGLSDTGEPVSVMHACGHDIHMTSMIGAARKLASERGQWRGTLILVGQPAEEAVDGAKKMLEAGLFEKFPRPDYNIALHSSAALAAGDVGMVQGYALANVDSVDIAVKGIGGHGAYPHTTKDPIVLASHIVVALQTLVSRETPSLEAAVVTVGSMHAGTRRNIISNNALLQLTVRSYTDEVRANLLAGIKRIAHAQAQSFGLPEEMWPEVTYSEPTPSTYNDPQLTERMSGVLANVLGAEHVHQVSPVMAGEDFSYFGRTDPKIPSLIFWLGAVEPTKIEAAERGELKLPSLHSPYYAPEREPTIKTGVEAMTGIVVSLMPANTGN